MTQRERNMGIFLGVVVVVGGISFGAWSFYKAIVTSALEIDDLEKKIAETSAKLKKVRDDAPVLQHYRRLSLPTDLNLAARDYREDVRALLFKHQVQDLEFRDEQPRGKSTLVKQEYDPVQKKPVKAPLWTSIQYQVQFKTKMANLVDMIKDFQSTPRMHRIKQLTVERADEKKEGELLAVQMTFEGISILDADKYQKKTGLEDVKFSVAGAADTVAALLKAPSELAMLGWAISPMGPKEYVAPLNPPLAAVRNYSDINRRNLFMGFVDVSGESKTAKAPPPPAEEIINRMRFTRFEGRTEELGKVEAWLWDSSSTIQKERLRTAGGFNKFLMLQTGDFKPVVHGVVLKIDRNEIIFRVTLKASDPSSSKWWRYPTYNHFYSLHPDDFSTLAAAGKVKDADKGNLYLVNQSYWEKLIKKQVEVSHDEKNFRFKSDFTRGQIVFSDEKVLIVLLNGWPPNLAGPSVGMERLYPDDATIYHVQSHHLAELQADKGLTGTKKVKAEEADRLYTVRTSRWDLMIQHKVVKTDSGKGTFTFGCLGFPDLIKGDMISRNEDMVVFRVAEKYCHCYGDQDLGIRDHWHEGFIVLKIGRMVQDALMEPLSGPRLNEYLKPAVSASN
jgi:hypothetical protein